MNWYNYNELPLHDQSVIFVFGSNTEGRHGKGSALYARQHFGAVYGHASGLQGRSYAIVTKNLQARYHPSISVKVIKSQIIQLYAFASNNPELKFYVAYTGYGSNLNGFTANEMAEMFACKGQPPENLYFEKIFYALVKRALV